MPTPKSASFRLSIFLLLAVAVCLPTLTVEAAKKKEEPTYNFTIPLNEVPNYLNNEELRDWRRLQRDIQIAQADIETGEWLEAKEYSAFISKERINADRKKGKDLKTEATARLAELTTAQNQLRLKAEEALQEHKAQFKANEISIAFTPLPLLQATEKPIEAMLYKLWNENYTKIYFAGAYVFKDGYYAKNIDLSDTIMSTIAKLDGNRYTLEDDVVEFSLTNDKGQTVIDFEEREKIVDKFKAAVIIVEVLYDQEAPSGLYAVHAINLKNGRLINQSINTYPIDDISRELLGEGAEAKTPAESADQTPAESDKLAQGNKNSSEKKPASKTANETSKGGQLAGIKMVLRDDNNFLGRLGDARNQYVFDIAYVGQIDGYDQRAAMLLNQALMRKQGLLVDDMDFITLALKPADADLEGEDYANAVWRVAPTTPVDFGLGKYAVQAQADQNGKTVSVDIGMLTIEAVDPNAIPPQASKE